MKERIPPVGIAYSGGVTVATLTYERILEDADLRTLEKTILPIVEPDIKLVMDFSSVQFLTSAALGLLIRISKKVRENQGQMSLCGIQPKIMEVFKITQLDRVFDIQPDVPAGLRAVQGQVSES
ncbi:MAG: STAS domain-containing protein [Sedimentisphaerales bacterium]|nr:STAS domain-containing protein [Sedimentisphaerales bacterium]